MNITAKLLICCVSIVAASTATFAAIMIADAVKNYTERN